MVDVNVRRHFCTLVAAAYVDGRFEIKEKSLLYRKAREMGLPITMVDEIIELGKTGKLGVSIPPTTQGREKLLDDLIEVVCADGRVETAENRLLIKFGAQIGLSPADIGERVRRRLGQGEARPRQDEVIRIVDDAPPPVSAPARTPTMTPMSEDEVIRIFQDAPAPVSAPARAPTMTPMSDTARIQSPGGTASMPAPAVKELPPGPLYQPGPMKLSPPMLGPINPDLPPITLAIVKQVLLFDGRDEAIEYVRSACQVEKREEAARIVNNVLRDNPDLKPGSQRVRVK